MAISFKNTAVLSKKQVNNLLSSIEESQNKISDHYYVQSDMLIKEAGSLIARYATCKRLHQNMKSMGLSSRAYTKRFLKDVEECVSSHTITDQEAFAFKQKLQDDELLCLKHRNVELIKKKAQSYIKTAIAYAEIDVDYVNIMKELMDFYDDIGTEFIADSICDICTTRRSREVIEDILGILFIYRFIFNDVQLQRIRNSIYPYHRVDFLDHFYAHTEAEPQRHDADHNTEAKEKKS